MSNKLPKKIRNFLAILSILTSVGIANDDSIKEIYNNFFGENTTSSHFMHYERISEGEKNPNGFPLLNIDLTYDDERPDDESNWKVRLKNVSPSTLKFSNDGRFVLNTTNGDIYDLSSGEVKNPFDKSEIGNFYRFRWDYKEGKSVLTVIKLTIDPENGMSFHMPPDYTIEYYDPINNQFSESFKIQIPAMPGDVLNPVTAAYTFDFQFSNDGTVSALTVMKNGDFSVGSTIVFNTKSGEVYMVNTVPTMIDFLGNNALLIQTGGNEKILTDRYGNVIKRFGEGEYVNSYKYLSPDFFIIFIQSHDQTEFDGYQLTPWLFKITEENLNIETLEPFVNANGTFTMGAFIQNNNLLVVEAGLSSLANLSSSSAVSDDYNEFNLATFEEVGSYTFIDASGTTLTGLVPFENNRAENLPFGSDLQ